MHYAKWLVPLLLCSVSPADAASLVVAWSPNSEPDLAGYLLKFGTERGRYTASVDTGLQTTWEIAGLSEGQRYYIVVHSYNTSGAISSPSDEVSGVASGSCTYGVSPALLHLGPRGDERTVVVSASPQCSWSASTTFPWLRVSGETSGTGNGAFSIIAAPLPIAGTRFGLVQVPPLEVGVFQGLGGRQATFAGNNAVTNQAATTIWRPGTGAWYLHRAGGPGGWSLTEWGDGWLGGEPVPGDYDGDGLADAAFWRQSDGTWHIRTAASGFTSLVQVVLGGEGDLPVPADYDGDGRTDLAVWTQATGDWRVRTSTSSYREGFTVQWGLPALGDQPVAGDFDGDGRADISVWRSTTGGWHILRSHLGYSRDDVFTTTLGSAALGDEPIVGDFDGDGAADIGVWRKTTEHVWCLRPSTLGFSSTSTRVARSEPASADGVEFVDVNGDGRMDVAVWAARTSPSPGDARGNALISPLETGTDAARCR